MNGFVALALGLSVMVGPTDPQPPSQTDSQIQAQPLETPVGRRVQFQRQPSPSELMAKAAVQRKAQFRAAQRQRRLAAQQWYGISNLRPLATPTPFTASPLPNPYMWQIDSSRWFGLREPDTSYQFIYRIDERP